MKNASRLIVVPYEVKIDGHPARTYFAQNARKARALAWGEFSQKQAISYSEFSERYAVKRGRKGGWFGAKITVKGEAAYRLPNGDDGKARFVRPGSDIVLCANKNEIKSGWPARSKPPQGTDGKSKNIAHMVARGMSADDICAEMEKLGWSQKDVMDTIMSMLRRALSIPDISPLTRARIILSNYAGEDKKLSSGWRLHGAIASPRDVVIAANAVLKNFSMPPLKYPGISNGEAG